MKAVRVVTPGGLEAVRCEDVPDPVAPPGWLTLEVKAASVNHLDLWVRRGLAGAGPILHSQFGETFAHDRSAQIG